MTQSTLVQLIQLLSDGRYHDGTTLGQQLKMTRSGVWKMIQKLVDYGIAIDSVKGKGYALLEPLILLDPNVIQTKLSRPIDIDIFESIDSTNEYLKKFLKIKTPRICIAEHQTHGKGRLHRQWHAPFGLNLYFSCLYPFHKDISELAGLSLMVSLSVVKTLNRYISTADFQVKWPNDVLHDHKKISGNLIEVQAESHGMCTAIIGIGININMMPTQQQPITQPWTSLRAITETYIDRNIFTAQLIHNVLTDLQTFEHHGLAAFMPAWHAADYLWNREIHLQSGAQPLQGIAQGINSNGYLLIKMASGEINAYSSGDTTLLKSSKV